MTKTTALRANAYAAVCVECRNWVEVNTGLITKNAAGKWETRHRLPCPPPRGPRKAHADATQPDLGYYVRADGAAIKVVENKAKTRRYGLVFTPSSTAGKRPSWEYVRGAGYSVSDLTPMTAQDAAQIGLAHGHCIECCAKLGPKDPAKPTLSALVSALIGYGETCAANNGWPYPKGVAAQRAFLAAGE
jgi:hypothetical protein